MEPMVTFSFKTFLIITQTNWANISHHDYLQILNHHLRSRFLFRFLTLNNRLLKNSSNYSLCVLLALSLSHCEVQPIESLLHIVISCDNIFQNCIYLISHRSNFLFKPDYLSYLVCWIKFLQMKSKCGSGWKLNVANFKIV